MNVKYANVSNEVIAEIKKTLNKVDIDQVNELIDCIQKAEKVFFVGVGRVLLSLESIAKRFAHLGINTYVVGQVTEPAIGKNDLLIVGSGSGETAFPLVIAEKAKKYNAKVIHIGSNENCSLKQYRDFFVRIPTRTKLYLKDEVESVQPMTSLFEQCLLLLGDIIALLIIQENNINMKELWQYHANLE